MHYESDYVLRLIEQMGGLVRRAVEQLRVGGEQESFELADQAIGLALEIEPEVVHRLSPQSLVALLELNNLDDRVIRLVGEALLLQAGALEQSGEIVQGSVRRQQSRAVLDMLDPARAN
jgi:hypothetical protein